jgi:hypothetical protein
MWMGDEVRSVVFVCDVRFLFISEFVSLFD